MGIADLTDYEALAAKAKAEVERWERDILRRCAYIAEKLVATARIEGNYLDQTGNLRSSIGAVVVVNGKVVRRAGFQSVNGGSKGTNEGRDFATELAAHIPSGIAIILVAGMEYALHVVARGRDVLQSAELEAETLVPRMFEKLSSK